MRRSIKRSIKSNIKVQITGGNEVASFAVSNQSISRGALTLSGAAAHTFTASSGTINSIGTVTGLNAADWAITFSGGTVTAVPASNGLPNGPYSLTIPCYPEAAQGGMPVNVTFTCTTTAGTYTIGTDAQAKTVAESSGLTYGQEIEYLEGSYNAAQTANFWKRTSGITGTFNGSNHVIVRPASGASVTIGRLSVDYVLTSDQSWKFENINFYRPYLDAPGSDNGGEGAAFFTENSSGVDVNIIVNSCTGGSTDTTVSQSYDIWSALRIIGNKVTITNNTFSHVFNGVFTAGSDVTIVGNTIINCRDDGIRSGAGDNQLVTDNVVLCGDAIKVSQHVDAYQLVGSGAQDNVKVLRNRFSSYNPASAGPTQWQGIFIDDTVSPSFITNCVVEGNIVVNAATNGILVHRLKGGIVRGNTLVYDTDFNTALGEDTIVVSECEDSFFNYNVCEGFSNSGGSNNDQTLNTVLDYDTITYSDYFVDPQTGSSLTNVATQFDIKASSAPDLESPKHGATSSYFDYDNKTQNPPYDTLSIWGFTPADDSTDQAIDVAQAITFNKPVQFGTGNVTIYDITNATNFEVFDVPADTGGGPGTVSISTATMTIEPTTDLGGSTEYARRIAATAIDDLDGNSFAGVTDNSMSFTTVATASGPNRVSFPGTVQFNRSSLTATASKQLLIYMAVYPDNAASGSFVEFLFDHRDTGIESFIQIQEGGRLRLVLDDASGNNIYNQNIASVLSTDPSVRQNILIAIDTAIPEVKIYVGDTEQTGFTTSITADALMNFSLGSVGVYGGVNDAGFELTGDSEAFYFAPGQWLDIDTASERRKFFDASGVPTNLSTAPSAAIKMTSDAAAWNAGTNEGDGGTPLTKVGAGTVTDV